MSGLGGAIKGAGKPAKKAKAVEAPAKPGQNADDGIDELAQLLEWEAQNKTKLDRIKKLKEKYSKRIKEGTWAADEEATLEGPEYDLIYSPCRNETTLTDARKAQELLGDEIFYQIVKLPTTELQKYLTEADMKQVAETTQTGPRTLKLARKRGG